VRGTDSVSTGPVEWVPDQPVHLRVTARVNGQQRTITARFTPQEAANQYRQLFTSSGRVFVDPPASADPALPPYSTIDLGGPVWQGTIESAADTLWPLRLRSWAPDRRILTGAADVPDLDTYFVRHDPYAATPVGYVRDEAEDENAYFLDADPGQPTYYRVPTGFDPGVHLYDMCDGAVITVSGRGCVVWEVPAGMRFLNAAFVRTGQGPHFRDDRCLVIVAGPDPSQPGQPAIFFEGGLQSDIPVILVSNGTVAIQHINNMGYVNEAGFSTQMDEAAIYARDVLLRGPRSATLESLNMGLRHPATGSLDRTWVPHLAQHGGLPNLTSASGHTLVLQPGTWRASAP
jgi:hypothetical protein